MTEPTKNKIPGPVYAAAGAGDLAYQQLRKLPAVVSELTEKASAGGLNLRERAAAGSTELRERAITARERARTADLDLDKLRAAVISGAQAAQEKATTVYKDLVSRGTQVIDGPAAEPAAISSESQPAALPAGSDGPGKPVAKKATKPVKRAKS